MLLMVKRSFHSILNLEMGEQIDQLQKLKNKLEKEKQTVKSEADDLRTQSIMYKKASIAAEKLSKQLNNN